MLRIRNVYPGSDFFPSRIPDPNCLHPGSASKNLSILTQKKKKEMGSNCRKYDPGCSSGCWLSTHPGSRIQGSKRPRIRTRNTGIFKSQISLHISWCCKSFKLSYYCENHTKKYTFYGNWSLTSAFCICQTGDREQHGADVRQDRLPRLPQEDRGHRLWWRSGHNLVDT